MDTPLTTIIIGAVILIGLFFILREFFCWYWKTSQISSFLEKQNETLLQILKYIEKEEYYKNKSRFPEATHIVTEDLRLRPEPDVSINPTGILEKGTLVVFIEEGAIIENANSISAPWFYIKTESGTQGWCFSGSLRRI